MNRLAAKVVSVPAGAVREAISAAGRFADFVAEARLEPALGFLDLIAPVLSRLPEIRLCVSLAR